MSMLCVHSQYLNSPHSEIYLKSVIVTQAATLSFTLKLLSLDVIMVLSEFQKVSFKKIHPSEKKG